MRTRQKSQDTEKYYVANYDWTIDPTPSCLGWESHKTLIGTDCIGGSYIEDLTGGRWDKPAFHVKWNTTLGAYREDFEHDAYNIGIGRCPTNHRGTTLDIPAHDVIEISKGCSIPYPNPSQADAWDRWINPKGQNFTETILGLSECKSLFTSIKGRLSYLSNVPKAIRGLPRGLHPRAAAKAFKNMVEGTLSSYLEWEFAWKQTGEDLSNLAMLALELKTQLDKVRNGEGSIVRVGFKRTGSANYTTPLYAVKATGESRYTVKLSYFYSFSGYSAAVSLDDSVREILKYISATQSYMGLNRSAADAWAIMPASWVIDQFLPIGDILSDLGGGNSFMGVTPVVNFHGSNFSQKLQFSITREGPKLTGSTGVMGGYYYVESEDAVAKGTIYRRIPSASAPPAISIRNRKTGVSNTAKAYGGLVGSSKIGKRR
jgi:hypothetical protein